MRNAAQNKREWTVKKWGAILYASLVRYCVTDIHLIVMIITILSSHLSLNHEGRWGTTDDFATSCLETGDWRKLEHYYYCYHYYYHYNYYSDSDDDSYYTDLSNDVSYLRYRFATLVDRGGGTLPLPAHQPLQALQVQQCLESRDVVLHHREVLVLYRAAHLATHSTHIPISQHWYGCTWGKNLCLRSFFFPQTQAGVKMTDMVRALPTRNKVEGNSSLYEEQS